MSAPAKPKPRLRSFTTTVDVDVDIDPEDLHAEGWHHESECGEDAGKDPEAPLLGNGDVHALGAAVASLHRQAHPSQGRNITLCREEPCRSLSLDQLAAVTE